jgi:anti-sigma factor RsiW
MNRIATTTQVPSQGSPSRCRLIRTRLLGDGAGHRWQVLLGKAGIDFETPWVHRHISTCPRCQRRFAHAARVQLALSLLRSRPMELGLLGKANAKAVSVLRRDTRVKPMALALRQATPGPTLFERVRQFRGALTQMAACMAIVTLGKIGMFSSIQKSQTLGLQAMHQYYADRAGQNLADEVYPQG